MFLLIVLFVASKTYSQSDTLVINTGDEIKLFLTTQLDSITFNNFSKSNLIAGENESQKQQPNEFRVWQNNSNHFNLPKRLNCYLPTKGNVAVRIYDINGGLVRQIFTGELEQGSHEFWWNGRNEQGAAAASGKYLFSVQFQNVQLAQKVVFLKRK